MPEDDLKDRREMATIMRRLCNFSKQFHLYQPQTQSMIECFVAGAEFIIREHYQPHPSLSLLERAGKVENELNRMLKQVRNQQENEIQEGIWREDPCKSVN